MGAVIVMCLTRANPTTIIDHHPRLRPTGSAYTRTFHHASQLSPGDLFRPDPARDSHTVSEVHRTRDRRNGPDQITLVDQYAKPYSYPVHRACPDRDPGPVHRVPAPHLQGDHPMITITDTPMDGIVLDGTTRR